MQAHPVSDDTVFLINFQTITPDGGPVQLAHKGGTGKFTEGIAENDYLGHRSKGIKKG